MGGAGLPGLLFFVVLLVAIGFIVFIAVPWARSQNARSRRITGPETETLEYVVPPGQDPAAVVAALAGEGFEAVTTTVHGQETVHIASPTGRDRIRAQARAVIAHESGRNLEGDPMPGREVRFSDE